MRPINKVNQTTATMSSAGSVALVAVNTKRKYLLIGGHTTVGLWLGLGQAAVVGTGLYIPAGASYEFDGDNLYQGAINGILTSGADQAVGAAEFI